METMKAMMEEMKKPRFVSHQEFDGLPDLPGPQDGVHVCLLRLTPSDN